MPGIEVEFEDRTLIIDSETLLRVQVGTSLVISTQRSQVKSSLLDLPDHSVTVDLVALTINTITLSVPVIPSLLLLSTLV